MDGTSNSGEITGWLEQWAQGDPDALDRLAPLVYDQLRVIADNLLRNEAADHTLQPTALVSETFLKLLESDPQTTFANIPSWALTNLANLADANGFGFVPDPTALLNEPPDPAVVAFEAQLANVGGRFITTSDTGFQTQPILSRLLRIR
jgi:hypothetical protein